MKLAIACCLLAVLISVGCRKKTTPTDPNPQVTPSTAPAAPKASLAPPTAASGEPANAAAAGKSDFERRLYGGNPQETLRALNQLIEGWQMSNPKPLTSLEQLVSAGAIPKIPIAPAGQRYAIDPKTKSAVLTQ